MEEVKTKKGGKGFLVFVVVLIIIAAAVYMFLFRGWTVSSQETVDSSKYQAIFLTNGQVYFGKVADPKSEYVSVADVYYLVLKQPLQNQQKDGEDQQPAQDQSKSYSLVKLGNEMHGPTSMSINRDQILFIENLRDDSKVVTAIKNSAQE